jgi:hypothetical protein
MRRLTLSLDNPIFELPHRVGMQGVAKLLDYCDRTKCLSSSITWQITAKTIDINWQCSDYDFFQELQRQAYCLKNGEIDSPCLELDDEERYVFSLGILNSFLQHNTHRKFTEEKQLREFTIYPNSLPIQRTIKTLSTHYYLGIPRNVFNKNGDFMGNIPLKSNYFPGLLEEKNGAGIYQATVEEFFVLYFLPLATAIYTLPLDITGNRMAMCFMNSTDLLNSLSHRIPRKLIETTITSAGDAALRVLANNNERNVYNLDHEVFILGPQKWNTRQKYLKQSVSRINTNWGVVDLYSKFYAELKPQYRVKEKEGEPDKAFISGSQTLGFITDNLIAGKPWHYQLGQYLLTQDYFEKETLIKMVASHTEQQYKDFRRIIQSISHGYLANSSYHSKSKTKILYLLNTPKHKQGFSKAFNEFFSNSELITKTKNNVELVTELIETDWRLAKDWTLQAIILSVPLGKENNPNGVKTND